MRLDPVMWEALEHIAHEQKRTVEELVSEIEANRSTPSLTSAIRIYVVLYYSAGLPSQRRFK